MKFRLIHITLVIIATFGGLKAQNLCSSLRFLDSIFSNSQIKKDSNIVYAVSIKMEKTIFPISVKITDVLGRIIVSKNVYSTDFQIENLKNQAKGTYFVEIIMADKYVYKKIIKH